MELTQTKVKRKQGRPVGFSPKKKLDEPRPVTRKIVDAISILRHTKNIDENVAKAANILASITLGDVAGIKE